MPIKYHMAENPYSYSRAVKIKIIAPVLVALMVANPESVVMFLSEIKKLSRDCFRDEKKPIARRMSV